MRTDHAPSPVEQWKTDYFTAAELADPNISGDQANSDQDRIPNLV